jgi:biopolymer transport protein ExbB/biopolymer transport protein TolQ
MQINLTELWHQMGPLAKGVVFVLLFMSIWSLWVAIDKYLLFSRAKKQSIKFAEAFTQELDKNSVQKQALDLTREKRFRSSHVAKITNAGLQEFLRLRDAAAKSGNPKASTEEGGMSIFERIQHVMERSAIMIVSDFKKGLSGLATIGATAPFVGLFGTVVGIINAFQAIKTEGAAAIGKVSGGIAEALITTAAGLFVAVPAVWLYNYFTTKVDRIQNELTNVSSDLLDYLLGVQEAQHGAKHI